MNIILYRISVPAGNGIIPSNITPGSTCIKAVVLSAFLPLRQILTAVRIGAQNFGIFFDHQDAALHAIVLYRCIADCHSSSHTEQRTRSKSTFY